MTNINTAQNPDFQPVVQRHEVLEFPVTQDQLETPTPRVAFGLGFAEHAKDNPGTVYDIDQAGLTKALQIGGMSNEQISRTPVIIEPGNGVFHGGFRPGGRVTRGPELELHAADGKGEITAALATHEARHLADHEGGEEAFTPDEERTPRKVGFVARALGSRVLTSATAYEAAEKLAHLPPAVVCAGIGLTALASVASIAGALNREYERRPEERRAFDTQNRSSNDNLLRITNEAGQSTQESQAVERIGWKERLKTIKQTLKIKYIPRFDQ